MMLVVGGDKQLTLYSGPQKVAMVTVDHSHMENMDGSVNPVGVVGIKDALGESFTLELVSGEMLRCCLPLLCRHSVGKLVIYCTAEWFS